VVAWTPLTVRPPAAVRGAAPRPVWVVRVWEPDPPVGVESLEWILGTTVPVNGAADAWERADWSAGRWRVEEYHRVLTTGGRLAASQLRDRAALWRRRARRAPVAARTRVPAAGMTLAVFWGLVARRGGHQGRRGDGPPGWQTRWRGWTQVQTLLDGVHLAHSLPDPRCG